MANKPSSLQQQNSRFIQGGVTAEHNNKVGWWERRNIQPKHDDMQIEISKQLENRPDLISYKFYGKSEYAWVVLQYNNIVDINEELASGKMIRLPTYKRLVFEILTKAVG